MMTLYGAIRRRTEDPAGDEVSGGAAVGHRGTPGVPVAIFAAVYLLVWAASGIPVYLAHTALMALPFFTLWFIAPLGERLSGYFYFHGAKGSLLLQLGRKREARESFDRAIALAGTAAEAAHIRMHIDRLIAESEARA